MNCPLELLRPCLQTNWLRTLRNASSDHLTFLKEVPRPFCFIQTTPPNAKEIMVNANLLVYILIKAHFTLVVRQWVKLTFAFTATWYMSSAACCNVRTGGLNSRAASWSEQGSAWQDSAWTHLGQLQIFQRSAHCSDNGAGNTYVLCWRVSDFKPSSKLLQTILGRLSFITSWLKHGRECYPLFSAETGWLRWCNADHCILQPVEREVTQQCCLLRYHSSDGWIAKAEIVSHWNLSVVNSTQTQIAFLSYGSCNAFQPRISCSATGSCRELV